MHKSNRTRRTFHVLTLAVLTTVAGVSSLVPAVA